MDSTFITLIMFLMKHQNFRGSSLTYWVELADLQKKKAELEFQLHSVGEKKKTLKETIKILEERLAIQELDEQLKSDHETLEQLESKVKDLENRLKEPQKEPETSTITKEPHVKPNTFRFHLKS
jgi:predicted  nucleic acid-binding Zn-ribbon protein